LRLGGHAVVTASAGSAPVLLLDDVFSELDPGRGAALVACLPSGQALLTTAGPVPAGIDAAETVHVKRGMIVG
jgi:recombinational DNA repair ATPase RecF